ncbi:MAG: SDR family NAD(P)-dependent oxidoreductase [Pseudomonadota bacterium]
MNKTILLTGATDGIGLETAKILASQGHTVLLHGRNQAKLADVKEMLINNNTAAMIATYQADLSALSEVATLATTIKRQHSTIDVLINNAGVFKTHNPITETGYDIRFVVNTIAPYLLTQQLLPLMNAQSRIVNLSSAAQAPVNLQAFKGQQTLADSEAYAQSKLAITMWTFYLAKRLGKKAPSVIAINPASFLGSKMVKEAYGSDGKDLSIGADILVKAALAENFAGITGKYFDNDRGHWAEPHPDALDEPKCQSLVTVINETLKNLDIQDTLSQST